ncbi:MAG: hypothetical protein ACLFRY_14520, partial [Spirochaetia bacterium]
MFSTNRSSKRERTTRSIPSGPGMRIFSRMWAITSYRRITWVRVCIISPRDGLVGIPVDGPPRPTS